MVGLTTQITQILLHLPEVLNTCKNDPYVRRIREILDRAEEERKALSHKVPIKLGERASLTGPDGTDALLYPLFRSDRASS